MKQYTLVYSDDCDWKGIYVDGTLDSEGHHWDQDTLVEIMSGGHRAEVFGVDNQWLELDEGGTFPLKLDGIPEHAKTQ